MPKMSPFNTIVLLVTWLSMQVDLVSSATVSLESFKCSNGDILQIENVKLSCSGSSECSMGQVATLDGELTLSEDLDTDEVFVDAMLKKFRIPLINLYRKFPTEFCAETTSTTGSTCPAAGSYAFSADVTIPQINNFVTGWTVTAVASFFDDKSKFIGKCEAVIVTESSWGGNATTTSVALLGGLTMVGLLIRRKRRRVQTAEETEGGDFNMMTDPIEMSRMSSMERPTFV